MYTAYPDDESEAIALPEDKANEPSNESILSSVAIHNKMVQFAERDAGELFSYISVREPTQYRHHGHQPMKRKGGRPPRDFELTEDFCDFCKLIEQGNLTEAIPLYFYLTRFSGG